MMIAMLVGRCHVSDTHREVIRYVISRLKRGHRQYRQMPREQRRDFMRAIIAEHNDNRALYRAVMRGDFRADA